MQPTEQMSQIRRLAGFACALALLATAFVTVSQAQEARRRLAPSLTSEDLLDRRAIVVSAPAGARIAPSSRSAASMAASTFYRDPAGAFTLNLPSSNWRTTNAKARSAGKFYSHRAFRRIEEEGFASATAHVYVFTDYSDLSFRDAARLSPAQQHELADRLSSRFLSSNVALVSIAAGGAGLHVVADQVIARRAVVRAAIDAFERQGRLFVVVCCAPIESFEASERDFNAITTSLSSFTTRS
jgi:hypothetical protein